MVGRKIVIAGGSGFLGRSLALFFRQKGDEVYCLTRKPLDEYDVYWDGKNIGDWVACIDGSDVLINMTGKSVDCRYTLKNKREILNSRIDSTSVLAYAVKHADHPPKVWLNASSATIYVHSESTQMTEDRGVIGDDFSMNVCKSWESEFFKHSLLHTRRVAMRTSIVFGKSGGAYPILRKLVKMRMGGKQGDGRQFVSWIHISDFCRSLEFIIDHEEIVGPINVAAPNPLRNSEFMNLVRMFLNRSFGMGQAKWLLEFGAMLIGTETELLLKSRNVVPERLLETGFKFEFNEMAECLDNLERG